MWWTAVRILSARFSASYRHQQIWTGLKPLRTPCRYIIYWEHASEHKLPRKLFLHMIHPPDGVVATIYTAGRTVTHFPVLTIPILPSTTAPA